MLASIIIQLLMYRSYNISILLSVIFISHITAVGFLIFLIYEFLSWFRLVKNYPVLWYTFAFSLLVINILISLVFFTLVASSYDPIIRLRSVRIALIDISIPVNTPFALVTMYDYISIGSFVLTWIPTVMLLKYIL
jgi:hypothetical protein